MAANTLRLPSLVARVGVFLSALWLAACDPGGFGANRGGPSIDPGAPVPVALLVPSGTGQSGDDVLAQNLENAARMAIADLSGVQVDLRVYSSGSTAGEAAASASRAVEEGAKIILGPVFAEAANAAGLAVAAKGVNVLSFSNNASIAGGNVFVLGNLFQNSADRLVNFAARQGRRNIFVVSGNDPAEALGREAVLRAIQRNPVSLAGSVSFEVSQQGVTSAISRIVSEARASGADTIFLTSGTDGALPYLAQLLPESGLGPDTAQFIGLQRLDIPANARQLPGLQGAWYATPDPGMTERFASRYAAAYGGLPHPIAGLAYDGIAAIGALVQAGQSDALTGAALTQGSGFVGVNGIFRLLPDGTNQRGLAVAQIQNSQVVVIDPAPRSFGGPGF